VGAEPDNKENDTTRSKLDDSKLQGLLRNKTEQKREKNDEEDEEGEALADAAEALRAKVEELLRPYSGSINLFKALLIKALSSSSRAY
jgi:hypothetical protein